MRHILSHVDEKNLIPDEKYSDSISEETYKKHYNKSIRGYAVISDQEGNVLETPNLVLLGGREFLAQKLIDIPSKSNIAKNSPDYRNYKIRYFQVGQGGADSAETPNKIGPFDNDITLNSPRQISDIDTSNYNYLHKGYSKLIEMDGGSINLVEEDHNINVNGTQITVEAYTTIKFTMNITKEECFKESEEEGPFGFNEMGLVAVNYDYSDPDNIRPAKKKGGDGTESSRYDADSIVFAHFCTLTKWLEVKDSLKVEWFILV